MRLTRWMLVASVWFLCVGAVATVAWYAIDSAGRQVRVLGDQPVRNSSLPSPSDAADGALSPTPAPAPTSSTTAPAPSVAPTVGEPAATGPAAGESRPGTTPADPPTGRRTTSPAPRTSTTTPRPSSSARPRSETVDTRGGSVTVTCSPSDPIDYVVTPDQGWSGRGKVSGRDEAEIDLSRTSDAIEVHARCVDGRPRTTVEDHGDDD